MFVRGQSKQRFGDVKEPYINVDQITCVEIGHDQNVTVRLANNEELIVMGDQAQKLLTYLEQNQLR